MNLTHDAMLVSDVTRGSGEPAMGQMGFFDIANRYAGLDAKNDPLVKIDEVFRGKTSDRVSRRHGASRGRTGSLRRDASRGMRW